MPKANLIAALLLAAFAIDRIVAAIFFAGAYFKAADRRESNRKIVYFIFSGMLAAIAVVTFDLLRILGTFWPPTGRPDARLDAVVTWLVLVAGADRLSSFIGEGAGKAAAPAAKAQELRLAGTLAVDDKSENVLRLQR
jgi:hypothetical protein